MLVPVQNGLPGAEEAISGRTGNVFALSCPSQAGCVALANEYGKSGSSDVYLIRLTATGHVVSSHAVSTGRRRQLAALSCTSVTRCWIAGTYVESTVKAPPLLAAWNGSRLTVKTIPVTGRSATWEPKGISCVASTCEMVGVVLGRGTAFAERTQGLQPSPVKTTRQLELTDVVCTSTSHCVATGNSGTAESKGFLSTITDGALGAPDYGSGTSAIELGSLTCRSSSCWATGVVTDSAASGGQDGAIYPISAGSPTAPVSAPKTYLLPAIATMGSGVIAAGTTLTTNRCAVVLLS